MNNTDKLYQLFLRHPLVSTDTRKIIPGSIFFALKGENFNGNKFAAEALSKGAAYAVIDEEEFSAGAQMILVEEVLRALQDLANHHRRELRKKGLKVFGLTGSNGKTTTKELLARVLSKKFNTLFTEGNLNNHIGVPLTLLRLTDQHEMAVIEMGANHIGEIAALCEIAEPDFGLITNIGLAHLEGFGGAEGVLKGKTELFRFLEKHNGTAFVFADDERLIDASKTISQIFYGTTEKPKIHGRLISSDPFVKFEWTSGEQTHVVQTHLAGGYNLPNLIAACAAGNCFGIPDEAINESIASYVPSNNRSQIEHRGTNTVILDCYNANPSSMAVAIENVAKMPSKRKILILGDMFELGESSAIEHQRIATAALEKVKGETVILVGKHFSRVNAAGSILLPDAAAVLEWLKKNPPEDALILVKGSRGMKMEGILEGIH
jgi:UDP-N-acetylmuramoyl-tripeptide--D-alanyl-D-alanine ligase